LAKIGIITPTKGQDIHLKQTNGKYELIFFIRILQRSNRLHKISAGIGKKSYRTIEYAS